jgi:hypothetical protein
MHDINISPLSGLWFLASAMLSFLIIASCIKLTSYIYWKHRFSKDRLLRAKHRIILAKEKEEGDLE